MTIWYDVDTALAEVPVNTVPLTDDTDYKTIETAVAYNAGGMALNWHFVTAAGAYTVTAVTPTSAGTYDWAHQAQGMYTIEIPASGGASINNDTEGHGWFTGFATGVLPWRGPTLGFRAAALNDSLCETNTTGLLAPAVAGRTLGVEADGDLTKVNTLDGHTAQTGDSYAIVNSGTHGNSALKVLIDALEADLVLIDNFVDDLEGRLTAARAGYLDNLSVGAVALEASVQSVLTKLLKYVQLLARKDAAIATDNATELTAINANGGSGGGAYSNQTDALEALQAEHDATQADLVIIDNFIDTEVAAILADTDDLQTRIPAALTADGNMKADSLRISGSATAADNLEASALAIVVSSVNDAAATTTVFVTALTEATNDHYKGRIIIFTSGALAGQATDITAYNGTTKAVTVTALTEAPANGTTFVML